MIEYLLLISIFLSGWNTANEHEFHLSKSLIEYAEDEKAIQITMHLFIDDLEDALKLKGIEKLYICTDKEAANAEEEVYKYLQENFSISIDNQALEYAFIGKEISEDLLAVWCYLEVTNVETFQQMEVMNRSLLEAFDDQKNLISIIGPNGKKGFFMLDKGKPTEIAKF